MAVYREIDGDIVREYQLEQKPVQQFQTEKALVEIVPTKAYGFVLFVDNELQLAEKDEHIYHELLIHPCMANATRVSEICVMGGGDGCAVREILKWNEDSYKSLGKIDVIDYDESITELFKTKLSYFNNNALNHPNVSIENEDLLTYEEKRCYDCIFIDLVDPHFENGNQSGIDFWSSLLDLAKHWLDPYGSLVINAGGILPWEVHTVNILVEMVRERFDLNLHIYKVFVPSFGREWCFLLLNQRTEMELSSLPPDLHYLSERTWKQAYSDGWSNQYLLNICADFEHQLGKNE